MKNGIVVLNVILLLAVGVLFYLYFNSKTNTTTTDKTEQKDSSITSIYSCQIAYFEMDSVEANFELAK